MKIIFTIIFFAGGAALMWGFAMPMWDRIKISEKEIAAYEDVRNRIEEVRSDRDRLIARYNNIDQANLDILDKLIPSKPMEEDLLLNFDALTGQYGLDFKSIGFKESGDSSQETSGGIEALKSLGENIAVSGSYESFRFFLNALENNIRLTDLSSINISGDAKTNTLSMAFSAQCYYSE